MTRQSYPACQMPRKVCNQLWKKNLMNLQQNRLWPMSETNIYQKTHVFRVLYSSTIQQCMSIFGRFNEELLGAELEELGSGLSALVWVECDCGSAVFSPLRGFRHLPMGPVQKKHNKKVSPWRQKIATLNKKWPRRHNAIIIHVHCSKCHEIEAF